MGGNIGIGRGVLSSVSTSSFNVAIGDQALNDITGGGDNIAIGRLSLSEVVISSGNIGIGTSALLSTVSGNNVGIGFNALAANTTGFNNIGIGINAGVSNFTGGNNVVIGSNADVIGADLSNCIIIGSNAFSSQGNQICLGNSDIEAFIVGRVSTVTGVAVDFGNLTSGGILFPQHDGLPSSAPEGAQVYDATNHKMYYTNGSNWVPMKGGASFVNVQIFDIPGVYTYTPTAGMMFCCVEVVGGGGSGESPIALTGNIGTGGGGGGYCKKNFNASAIGASQSIKVGAGGASVTNGDGLDGGASSFGTFLTANFGGGGKGSVSMGTGGTATGGDINITGSRGAFSYDITAGGVSRILIPSGGDSFLSNNNRDVIAVGPPGAIAGFAGQSYGGGGSSSYAGSGQTVQPSGAGANGVVIITEYF